jgi:hypothetical protein
MRRPSFPTVLPLIARFIALGGTSYAVISSLDTISFWTD